MVLVHFIVYQIQNLFCMSLNVLKMCKTLFNNHLSISSIIYFMSATSNYIQNLFCIMSFIVIEKA